ncbi:hypothetical protein D6D24_02065 [Aureobasidium pullulans]|uniref:Uncharacterized protein n=1 Tax=Aureobasidium pullulans TaxID=5580 RepID=A0A4S8W8Y2_AURPU|nr:hypothetical protein D6D24_02065 [Aureobasidium pullulans]
MDDPLKGYFNHQGVRHISFRNHRKYRRSYHGSLNHRHHHYNPRPSSIYPLNSATKSTTNSSIPTATKPSTGKCTLDPTSDLDPITRLTAVSRQIRTKVHKPTASDSTFYIKAGVFCVYRYEAETLRYSFED